jgi:hypothetical protein
VSSFSNGLYFLTLLLVSVKRVIYTQNEMSIKFGVCVKTLSARYLSKNTVISNWQSTHLIKSNEELINVLVA